MWSGFAARMVIFVARWRSRAWGLSWGVTKRVPGPRRVVVSFQFGGLDEELVIWAEDRSGIFIFGGSGSGVLGLWASDEVVRRWSLTAVGREGSSERRW